MIKNRGMSLIQIIVIAAAVSGAVLTLTKQIRNQTKERNTFLTKLSTQSLIEDIGIQLLDPANCSQTFGGRAADDNSSINEVRNASGTGIYNISDEVGPQGSKVIFQGIAYNNYDAATDSLNTFIKIQRKDKSSGGKEIALPLQIKITSYSSGNIIDKCHANSLPNIESALEEICTDMGGTYTNGKCQGIQNAWQEKSIEKMCDDSDGGYSTAECSHPNLNDSPCPGPNCFAKGYSSTGKLVGCSPDCNCSINYATTTSCLDPECGVACQGTCINAPNPSFLPPACGVGSASIPNRCIGGSAIAVARPACPTPTATLTSTPANTPTSIVGSTSTPVNTPTNIATLPPGSTATNTPIVTIPPTSTRTNTPTATYTATPAGPCTLGSPGCFFAGCPDPGRACVMGAAYDPICACYGGTYTIWKCQGGVVVYTSIADPSAGHSCI